MKLRPLPEPAAKANNVSRCLTEQLHRLNPFFIYCDIDGYDSQSIGNSKIIRNFELARMDDTLCISNQPLE